MNFKVLSTVLLASASQFLTAQTFAPAQPLPITINSIEDNAIANEYIIWLKKGNTIEKVLNGLKNQGIEFNFTERLSVNFDIYYLKTATANPYVLSLLKRDGKIAMAQYNHNVTHRATTPNDASFTQQWSLKNTGQSNGTAGADIDATLAWDIAVGGVTTTNDTVVIAVIDGGFQLNHPDLTQNIFRNRNEIAGNGIDDDANGYIDDINGWDAYGNDGGIPSDQHGTHVSGTIAARGNNSIGVTGVNWYAKVLTIAGSSGTEATVVRAYGYAADMRLLYDQTNGAKGAFVVATNSSFGVDLGNPNNFPVWCNFYDSLGVRGILSAGATANANYNVDTQGDIPTACASNFLISVTNTTRTDAKNSSCGYGLTTIDLGSPGTDVYSTVTNSGYQNLTGTSMATPHVAGVVGLMYSAACPQLIDAYKANPGTIALQMKQFLLNGTDPIASMNNITVTGGRLNAYKALVNVQSYPCNPTAPPTAAFSGSNTSGCGPLTVSFNNTSSFNADTYQWFFPGGQPSQSTDEDPVVTYNALGQYNVTLIATNQFGADTLELLNYVDVNTNGIVTVYTEDFEGTSLSAMGWTVENPDGENTWELVTVAGNTPGTKAPRVNIFQNQSNVGQRDALISPAYDFSNNTNFVLSFEHAHRRRTANQRDSLIISVSTDDGATFPFRVFARAENGQGSFATAGLLNGNFTPGNSDDWCLTGNVGTSCLSVDLGQFDGQPNVRLKFEVYNNAGNNIYIDNLEFTATCSAPLGAAPVAQFTSNNATNGICLKDTVLFTDISQNIPTTWIWQFDGGTPSTSTLQNPVVTYNSSGVYNVTLISTNAYGVDTLTIVNYVTVNSLPPAPTITKNANILSSSVAVAYQWNDTIGPIAGAIQQTFAPNADGGYSVTITDANGCKSTSNLYDIVLGVNELLGNIGVTIYPNPATDNLFIAINTAEKRSLNLDLVNMLGQTVWAQYGYNVVGKTVIEAPLTGLPKGMYFLRINQAANYKVVVK